MKLIHKVTKSFHSYYYIIDLLPTFAHLKLNNDQVV
jgi:hypothetical protein